MICRSCLQRATALGQRSIFQRAPIRRNFSAISLRQSAAAAPAPAGSDAATPTEEAAPRSTCPPGTTLNGLNYFKGKTDPVALPDNEYPEWLWSCLDVTKGSAAEEDADAGDEFCTFPCQSSPVLSSASQREVGNIELTSSPQNQRNPRSSAG